MSGQQEKCVEKVNPVLQLCHILFLFYDSSSSRSDCNKVCFLFLEIRNFALVFTFNRTMDHMPIDVLSDLRNLPGNNVATWGELECRFAQIVELLVHSGRLYLTEPLSVWNALENIEDLEYEFLSFLLELGSPEFCALGTDGLVERGWDQSDASRGKSEPHRFFCKIRYS